MGIEEPPSCALSIAVFLLALLLMLLKGVPFRALIRLIEGGDDGTGNRHLMEMGGDERVVSRHLHPSEDTTGLFD